MALIPGNRVFLKYQRDKRNGNGGGGDDGGCNSSTHMTKKMRRANEKIVQNIALLASAIDVIQVGGPSPTTDTSIASNTTKSALKWIQTR